MATRDSVVGEIINIGPDEEFVSINELARTIADLLEFKLEPIYLPDRPQEVKLATCSSDKARRLLGYQTATSLRDGLAGHGFILDPRATCDHFGGASEGMSSKTRWRKDWNQTWGTFYYEDKHGEPGSGMALARCSLVPFVLKALVGLLLLRRKTVVGYLAKAAAAYRYINGGPSWGRQGVGPQAALLESRRRG